MNRQHINDLTQSLDRSRNNQESSPYDHIGEWFDPKLLKSLQPIESGASAIRPVGRLGFFHNHNDIRQKIENADNRTNGHSETLMKKKYCRRTGVKYYCCGFSVWWYRKRYIH